MLAKKQKIFLYKLYEIQFSVLVEVCDVHLLTDQFGTLPHHSGTAEL